MRPAAAIPLLLAASLAHAATDDVVEPRSGVAFPARVDGLSLLGVGLRTRTVLNVKVYAIGFHVAEEALRSLAGYKNRTSDGRFYDQLIWGDFRKQVTLRFLRDVTREQIRDAFQHSLSAGDGRLPAFLEFFGDTRAGQEYVLRWIPGRGLETIVAGETRPVIEDKAFAAAIFAVWLGRSPIQDDIKQGLVSRASQLLP